MESHQPLLMDRQQLLTAGVDVMTEKTTMDSSESERADQANSHGVAPSIQFRLSTVFLLTLIASILAAFLSPRGDDLIPAGLITVSAIGLISLVVGYLWPPLTDRIFWGIVVTAMMQAMIAEVILLDRSGIYGWPMTAGLAAIFAAGHTGLYRRMLLGAIPAAVSMVAFMSLIEAPSSAKMLNIFSAGAGGALLGVMIELFKWIDHKKIAPQPVVGLSLVVASIAFSLVAPKIIPGW